MTVAALPAIGPAARRAVWRPWRAAPASRAGLIGFVLVGLILLTAAAAPLLCPHSPTQIDVTARLAPPSLSHWLGTDQLGRDVFSRMVLGTRTAMAVALSSVGLSLALALALGLLAGYGPRWLDLALLLVFDSLGSVPLVVLGLTLVALLGAGAPSVILAIVLALTPPYARVARAQTLSARTLDYVSAARLMNAGALRILVRHLLPNVVGPLLVLACLDVSTAVSLDSGLSFLGMGISADVPNWGNLIASGLAVVLNTPWPVLAGTAPLIVATLGFTFAGEALRDALDPRLSTREGR